MGTPVSKSAENSLSETDTEFYSDRTDGHKTGNFSTRNREIHSAGDVIQSGKSSHIPKPRGKENVTMQALNGTDDDIDEKQCNETYKRLKTNRNENLHVSNTRFHNDKARPVASGKSESSAGNPVFTSTVVERNTRINSANFNPHSVFLEREKTRMKSAVSRKKMSVDNTSDKACTDGSGERGDSVKGSNMDTALLQSHVEFEDSSTSAAMFCETRKDSLKPFAIERIQESSFQGSEYSGEGKDRVRSCSLPRDNDADPLEGLDIPRERVCSIGTASIYSTKEISDDLYIEYMAEIKSCLRSYGFFEAFPSPSVVREAQNIYRKLDMPTPVDDDGNILPHPSKITKQEFMSSETESLTAVRQNIAKVPTGLQADAQSIDIVQQLCTGLDDQREKILVLTAWVVYQQLTAVLLTRDDCCKRLFALCRFARIKTRKIQGIVRDPAYTPGQDLEKHRAIWVAALVNNTWILVDPFQENMATYYTANNNRRKIDGEILFTCVQQTIQDPERFIFSHFPDDQHWQLLARPVTKDELTELAVARPAFFDLNMCLVNLAKSVFVTKDTEMTLYVSFPENVQPKFKCTLRPCDKSLSEARARTYVFLETLMGEKRLKVRLRFPKTGSYILDVFVATDKDPGTWSNLLTTRLVYEGSEKGEAFPDNPREEWGPGLDTALLGLIPKSFHTGEIKMQKGIIQIAFKDNGMHQFNHVLCKDLRCDQYVDSNCFKVSFLKDKYNDVVFVVDIDMKVTGIFILQLLAREDKRADFFNFCTYLIRKEKTVLIPKLEFAEKQNKDEHVMKAPDSGQLQLTVDATGFIQLCVELKLHDRQELNFSEHARHWIMDDKGFIDLNFPRQGKYTLLVLGRTVVKGRFQNIRTETIHVSTPSCRWSPFPKECGYWNSWYKIEAPLTHHLEEKEDVEFVVDIKHAQDVAVLAANGWFHLDRQENTWTWRGQVWTGPKDTRCRLLARFEVGSEKWSDLLWFKIMSDEDYERMDERQQASIEYARKQGRQQGNG